MKQVISAIKEVGKKLTGQTKTWAKEHPVLAVLAGLIVALGVAWLIKKIIDKFDTEDGGGW